jgi:hypothetical protein
VSNPRELKRTTSAPHPKTGETFPNDSSKDLDTSFIGLPLLVSEDKVGDNEESLLRCSEAFSNDSALGGYFTKLQDLKQKEPQKPESWNAPKDKSSNLSGNHDPIGLVLSSGDADISLPSNLNIELGKGSKKPNSAKNSIDGEGDEAQNKKEHGGFKTPKRIKKLFNLSKSPSKDSSKNTPKEKNKESTKTLSDAGDTSKDEAVILMEEWSNILSPMNRESPKKSQQPQRTRNLDDVNDPKDPPSEEFPEIPTEKKTSLSDIRRMMDACKVESSGAPVGAIDVNAGPRSGRRTSRRDQRRASGDNSRGTENTNESPTSVAPGPPLVEENSENPPAPRPRRRASRHSGAIEKSIPEDSEVQPDRPSPAAAEHAMQSPRRHRTRVSKRVSSESSSSNEMKSSLKGPDHPGGDGGGDGYAAEKQSGHRRQRGHRRSGDVSSTQSSIISSTPEGASLDKTDDGVTTPPTETSTNSSGSRSRRSQRRSTEKNTSGGSSDKPDGDDENEENIQTPFATRRSRPSYKRNRASADRSSRGDLRNHYVRSLSMGNVHTPREEFDSAKSHSGRAMLSIPEGVFGRDMAVAREDQNLSDGDDPRASQEEPISESEEKSEEKADGEEVKVKSKNISLAESLERGSLTRLSLLEEQSVSAETISTDGGSEMFVTGQISYSCIKSSEKLSAPQLIFGSQDTENGSLGVRNV